MIGIYGSPVSNCYNTVVAAAEYKQLGYVGEAVPASRDSAFLQRSPMGKIPYIEHDGVNLSETSAIVEYFDEVFAGPKLFSGTALQRARQRQLMKFIELYVESPARRLFPGVFWFMDNDPLHIDEVRPVMERGLIAAELILADKDYPQDGAPNAAEFYTYFSLALAGRVTESQYNWSITEAKPLLKKLMLKIGRLDFVNVLCSQRDEAMTAYLNKKAAEAAAR